MAFIVAEDEALKSLLQGLTVSDERNPARQVGVWFGLPDPELREQKYPFISLDLVGISFAADRARSGPYQHIVPYLPPGVEIPVDDKTALGVAQLPPQPYNLDYQITTWTRNPRHDRQLLAALLSGPLPFQVGQLAVAVDETERRLDLTSISKRDIIGADKKRIYRNVFSVRMSSELYYYQLTNISTVWSGVIVQGGPDIGELTPITVTAPVN